MKRHLVASLGLLALGSAALVPGMARPAHAATSLVGAGSTFDFPFFSKAFSEYSKKHSVSINYQPIGSGAGIQQFIAKTVDFGATDVPMDPTSDLRTAQSKGGPVQQIPITLGGVAVSYNLPGVRTGLHLTGSIVADIYLGIITKWNDRSIRKLNSKVHLPDLQITPVYRSDGSGTSYAFTDYLSKISDTWRGKVGAGKLPNWPVGVGQKGNQGVASAVSSTPGAIGYIELAYVIQNHMKDAALQNKAKKFVMPSATSIAADARAFKTVSARNFSIANGSGVRAYPIATYSWILLYQHQPDRAKGAALVTLFKWMLTSGQSYAKKLNYVVIPTSVSRIGQSALKTIH